MRSMSGRRASDLRAGGSGQPSIRPTTIASRIRPARACRQCRPMGRMVTRGGSCGLEAFDGLLAIGRAVGVEVGELAGAAAADDEAAFVVGDVVGRAPEGEVPGFVEASVLAVEDVVPVEVVRSATTRDGAVAAIAEVDRAANR